MKDNKPKSWLSFITERRHLPGSEVRRRRRAGARRSTGTTATSRAQVGPPQIETVEDSKDGKTRWMRLRDPGRRGRALQGRQVRDRRQHVDQDRVPPRRSSRSGRRLLQPEEAPQGLREDEGSLRRGRLLAVGARRRSDVRAASIRRRAQPIGPEAAAADRGHHDQMDEGKQFFVNRITFIGNTTTHDTVIRREMRVCEGGVFNSEALKDSVRRLNQLGYFKPLEGKEGEMDVDADAGRGQQGRHQAEVRGAEPQPARRSAPASRSSTASSASCRSRRRTSSAAARRSASRCRRARRRGSIRCRSPSRTCSIGRSRPAWTSSRASTSIPLPVHAGDDAAATLVFGLPLGRLHARCSWATATSRCSVFDINAALPDPAVLAASPYLRDSLLLDQGGRRTVSKISPSVVFNTVNQPIFPTAGTRYTRGVGRRRARRQHRLHRRRAREGIWYIPVDARACRSACAPRRSTSARTARRSTLPIFEKFFLGGEYSVRGFDIRSIGPRDPVIEHRDRRQQDAALQRRVLRQRRRPGPRARVLRRGPGAGHRPDASSGGSRSRQVGAADRCRS